MTTRKAFAAVLVLGIVTFGCNGPTPTAPEAPEVVQESLGSGSAVGSTNTISSGESGDSGCYTVSGTMDQTAGPGGFSGTISGDIEGTVATVTKLAVWHRYNVHQMVEQTWEVTGGVIDPLIGQTVLLETHFVGVFRQFPTVTFKHTARIVEGARKGNLTYHGFTDASLSPPQSHLQYRGVICP